MRQLLSRVASFVRIDGKRRARRQGGYVVIVLAAIGLFGGIAAAAPILNRAVSSLKANEASPVQQSGARSAAEYAMWRLQNEPSLWSSMTGEPPSIGYTYSVLGSDTNADVDIVALSAPPANPFRISITATPDNVNEYSFDQVTFTLTVINDDVEPHQIDRVTMYGSEWAPSVVSGSISGMTTSSPTLTNTGFLSCILQLGCKYTWSLSTPVTVAAFGGEQHLTWTGRVASASGSYTMPAEVRFTDEGTFSASDAAQVRVNDSGGSTDVDLSITETVTPNSRSAGVDTTYDYTLTVTNEGDDPLTVNWLRHWSPSELSYVYGSSEINGAPVSDPGGVSGGWLYHLADFISQIFTYDTRDRYLWDIPPTVINPDEQIVLTFQMQGGLDPGIYHSRGEVLVDEAPGDFIEDTLGFLLQLPTAQTGDTAEITISQGFTITAEHEGHTVVVSGYIKPGGIDILSWKEN